MLHDVIYPLSIRILGKVISYLIFLYLINIHGSSFLGEYGEILNTIQLISSLCCVWVIISINAQVYKNNNLFYFEGKLTNIAKQFLYNNRIFVIRIGLSISLIYIILYYFIGSEKIIFKNIAVGFLILLNIIFLYNQNSIRISRQPIMAALSGDFLWSIIFMMASILDYKYKIFNDLSIYLLLLTILLLVLIINNFCTLKIIKNLKIENVGNILKYNSNSNNLSSLGASSADIIASKIPIFYGGLINVNPQYLGIFMISSIPIAIYQIIDAVILSKYGNDINELNFNNKKYKNLIILILILNSLAILLISLIHNYEIFEKYNFENIFNHLYLFMIIGYIKYGFGLISIRLLTLGRYKDYILTQIFSIMICITFMSFLNFFQVEYVYSLSFLLYELSFHLIGRKYLNK